MGHLILSRKRQEKIRIGEDIVVGIVSIGKQKVRLSVTAPDNVNILRDELEDYDALAVYRPQANNNEPKEQKC